LAKKKADMAAAEAAVMAAMEAELAAEMEAAAEAELAAAIAEANEEEEDNDNDSDDDDDEDETEEDSVGSPLPPTGKPPVPTSAPPSALSPRTDLLRKTVSEQFTAPPQRKVNTSPGDKKTKKDKREKKEKRHDDKIRRVSSKSKKEKSSSSTSRSGKLRRMESTPITKDDKQRGPPLPSLLNCVPLSGRVEDTKKEKEAVLSKLPFNDSKDIWQHAVAINELMKEYLSSPQGLSKLTRRQRSTAFGPNHSREAFPPKLEEKTVCQVLEDGEWVRIHPRALVPGDVFLLRPDQYVPADARVLTCYARVLTCWDATLHRGKNEDVLRLTCDPQQGDPKTAKNIVYQGDVIASGWGTALMLRPGEKSSSTFTPRFADQIMFDTHTQALVDEMEKVNGIEMMSTAAPAELANTTLLVAQHGAFLMGHPEIKSVYYDGEFILAPLIKWIAARERLAAFSGQSSEAPSDIDHSNMSVAELFASGAYDAALKKLKSETQSGKVLFNTGLVHMKAGNLSEARRVLGEALSKDKYLAVGYFQRGAAALRSKRRFVDRRSKERRRESFGIVSHPRIC